MCVSWKLGLYSKQCSPLRKEFVFKVGNPFRSVFCFAIKTDKFKADLVTWLGCLEVMVSMSPAWI